MRTIKKALLTVLAILPVASISTVAYCQLNELAGENQTDLLRFKLSQARRLLFPSGVYTITRQEAKERLSKETGITDEQALEEELERQLKILLDSGLIEMNELASIGSTPSAW